MMIFILVACQKPAENKNNSIEESKIEVVDIKGRQVVLDKLPEKIVSLSPSNTEIIFALDAGDKLVGVTSFCDYPEEAKSIEKIGDFENPNVEMIKKVQPDVIFAGVYTKDEIATILEGLDIPVIFTEAPDFETIYDSINLIGSLVKEEDKAEKIVHDMHKTIDDIKSKVKDLEKPNIFYVSWTDPLITTGKGTFIHNVMQIAGANNVAENVEGWTQYSVEELIKQNPDMIISSFHATDEGLGKEDLMNDPMFKNLDCVKKGNIYVMKDDNIIARPGPRIIDAIFEMANAIHGDIF